MNRNLKLREFDEQSRWYDSVLALYTESFPECERKPFEMILNGCKEGKMEAFVIEEEDELAGLAFFILGKEFDILDYLAISPAMQGSGIGSKILEVLMNSRSHPFIVEIESTLNTEEEQPKRRKAFYLRNGMIDCNVPIELFGVPMELLSSRRKASFAEYYSEMKRYFGSLADEYIRNLET